MEFIIQYIPKIIIGETIRTETRTKEQDETGRAGRGISYRVAILVRPPPLKRSYASPLCQSERISRPKLPVFV